MDRPFEFSERGVAVRVEGNAEQALEIEIAVNHAGVPLPVENSNFPRAQCGFDPPARDGEVAFHARAHDRVPGLTRIQIEYLELMRGEIARSSGLRRKCAEELSITGKKGRGLQRAISFVRCGRHEGRVRGFLEHIPDDDALAGAQRPGAGSRRVDRDDGQGVQESPRVTAMGDNLQHAAHRVEEPDVAEIRVQ